MKATTEVTRRTFEHTWYRIWTDKNRERFEKHGVLPDEICIRTIQISLRPGHSLYDSLYEPHNRYDPFWSEMR